MGFAKQSGGEVDVRSRPGAGATFIIYLPRHVEGIQARHVEGIQDHEERAQRPTAGSPRNARVLVVEDNSVVGQLATEMLADLGYRTTWAPNAVAALTILSDDSGIYDLVFSDVVMPGMTGLEMAHAIRQLYPDLPVILTTGYSQALAESGTDGFELVQKPYSVGDLASVMQRALAR